ncbi:MAG: carbohydrate porin [Deltaproteobacteria bacterium]|nr:carbohydrate porin [Deltaproteobacteria bacterium]
MIRRSSVLLLLTLSNIARADLEEDPCACSPNKPGFFRRGTLLGYDDLRADWKDDGFIPQAVYAGEVFAAPGLQKQFVVAGLFSLSVDVDLAKAVHDHLGSVHASVLAIHGDGLSAELADIYGVSGNVAPQDVRVFEAWLEQPLGPVTVRAGLLSADQEYVLAKHSTALLNATFGIISQLSTNLAGHPVYPYAVPGVSARYEGSDVTVRGAVFDGEQKGEHGIPDGIGPESLVIGQVELARLVTVGAWHHSQHGNGYFAILDHQLERYVAAFARVSYSPRQLVSTYIDTGLRIGPGPFRDNDFIGVGVAYAQTSDPMLGSQPLLEATYQAQFGWLTIQPDAQLLMEHPRTTAIVATRVTVVF